MWGEARNVGASAVQLGDEANLSRAKAAVDDIVRKVHARFTSFNISDIVKGGSLGHGTAVPGHYDIDLVIYSRDVKADEIFREGMLKKWTDELQRFISQEFGVHCHYPGRLYRSVQFKVLTGGLTLEVDLLVSPYWQTPHEFYTFLRRKSKDEHDMLTVCASRWQVDFFQSVENQVKEYIRRAKAWRNRIWRDSERGKPSSYLMSLLVLKAYEIAKAGSTTSPIDVTAALKRLVNRYNHLDVYWEGIFYRRAEYPDLLPSRPRVIDPANPANNVWESGFHPRGDYSVLVMNIDTIDLSRIA